MAGACIKATRLLGVAGVLVLLAQGAAAQEANCAHPTTTYDARVCTDRQVERSDSLLRMVEDSLARTVTDTAARALRRADSAWRAYRAAECVGVAATLAGGSYAPVVELQCWLELTDQRRRFLRRSYEPMERARR